MSYNIAAIDIHKKVLIVVVAGVAEEVADATGAAVELEGRKFGSGARERNHLVSWLQQRRVGSTRWSWNPPPRIGSRCGWIWNRIWRSCIGHRHNPTVRPKGARTTFGTPSVGGGVGWLAN